MNNMTKLKLVLAALLCLPSAALAQKPPSDVHVKLTLADNKTTYRIGETIKLILEFTAERDGYQADIFPDRSEKGTDSLSVTPDSGVGHWWEEIGGDRYMGRDVMSFAGLSTTPTRVELVLNDKLRIDRPGRYSASVTTRRVMPVSAREGFRGPFIMTTNEVSFDVQSMSESEESERVKRISEALDATHDWRREEELTRELSFLTGDESSREKVRRCLDADGRSGNYSGHIYQGLFIARNRGLVLQLLETAMRDAGTAVTSSLLNIITSLRFLQQTNEKLPALTPSRDPNADSRITAIQDAYVQEMAASLSKRAGTSQRTTAITILSNLPKDPQSGGAMLSEVRRIILQEFDKLNPFEQESLLEQHWQPLRDPSIVPLLEKILSSRDRMRMAIHRSVLKRLIDIAPERAKPYVIAEIRDPQALVDPTILGSLPDQTIPEVDSILLEQLRRLAAEGGVRSEILLKQKAALAVRYATNSIYPDLMAIYTTNAARLTVGARASLLAYLAKHNEQEVLPLIEQALSEIPPGQEFNFLPELTRLYFSEGIDALLKSRLDSDDPEIAQSAAYLISQHGPPTDQQVLEKRLTRWRKEWSARLGEAAENKQGLIEMELVSALLHAKSWQLAPERVRELQQSCLTKYCSQNFRTQ